MKKIYLIFVFFLFMASVHGQNNYNIGVGRADITGQIAETNFFGYGEPFASNSGIQDRQYARAYVIEEPGSDPVVYVLLDKGGVFQSVNDAVLDRLKKQFGDLYQDANVFITATHTHVSPAGYSYYSLYDTSVGGFYKTNFDILINGIVSAITEAHESKAPGSIYYNSGELYNASINRSLVAYEANKDADQFPNIDPTMQVLKFVQGDEEIGMISFFAVHPVSFSKDWELCSGDNKGYASLKFEKAKGASYGSSDKKFVAAFSNTNPGDMSPNLNMPGPDKPFASSSGPGADELESTQIIGDRQYEKAMELYNTATILVEGSIKAVSRYTDMSDVEIDPKYTDGEYRHTCPAILGTSFAAGAEDGRSGISVEGLVSKKYERHSTLGHCHMEKDLFYLFNMGANEDNPGSQKILPVTILKIGQIGLLGGPGEFTIMSGRRILNRVASYDTGIDHLVFVGYTDAYAGYITTREEYATQQYEGASTHFGPWTQAAYEQAFAQVTEKLIDPSSDPWGYEEPKVPVMKPVSADKTAHIFYDNKPWGKQFGDIKLDVENSYKTGERVEVVFWGAHPNNNPMVDGTYLKVQKLTNNGWETVYTDKDFSTQLIWKRKNISWSHITVNWKISQEDQSGTYRIVHDGHWKNGWTGRISPYTGTSNTFKVNQTLVTQNSPLPHSISYANELEVFPNPTSGNVNVINSSEEHLHFNVFNTLGQMVKSGHLDKGKPVQFNIDGDKGVYFINFTNEEGVTYQTKIVKN